MINVHLHRYVPMIVPRAGGTPLEQWAPADVSLQCGLAVNPGLYNAMSASLGLGARHECVTWVGCPPRVAALINAWPSISTGRGGGSLCVCAT